MDELTDGAIIAELGRRAADARIARQLTQDEFADVAGVGRSTVQRLERGESIQLTSFVKLLRSLDRLDALDAVLPRESRSPLAELARAQRQPKRFRRHVTEQAPAEDEGTWTWGDA